MSTATIAGTIHNARFLNLGRDQVVAGNLYGAAGHQDGKTFYSDAIEDVVGDIAVTKTGSFRFHRDH